MMPLHITEEGEEIIALKRRIEELERQRDELLAALEDLCTFETPLTQDKWNFARDLIQAAKEQGK